MNASDESIDDYTLQVEGYSSSCDENTINPKIQGRRIVDFRFFMEQLYAIDAHSAKFGCRLTHIKVSTEKQVGFSSTFHAKCIMCGSIFTIKTSDDSHKIDINSSAVSGTIMTGIGLSSLNELAASVDLPTIPFRLYSKCHDIVAEMWKNTAEETMQKAGQEEAEAARLRGDINSAGVPKIAVQADACWSKHSYKSNYSALSGVGRIIGEHSGKVLHIGVRNKYCVICTRAKKKGVVPRVHKCTKNHFGSSTSMEQAILVEGFKQSIKDRNLIYKTLIADGDSSTYKNILESRPYPDVPIQKIECTNHLLRNYNGKNLKLLTDTSIPHSERKLLNEDRQNRLRKAIRVAVKHRN
ncbi:uncharacterized protein LOC134747088 [Cydia strobilella]|uniref:uncharacterized protein LOC134747088 n=1 Tax=Cydia strobilella TaxID=1100964 RepID=UPI003004965D